MAKGLSKADVAGAEPNDGNKERFLWCGKTAGFGVRIYPMNRSGVVKKVFVAQVRVGRSIRRVKIGPFGPLTVEQARKRAEQIIAIASEGRDPQHEKRARRLAPTVAELCREYMEAARLGLVVVRRFKRPKQPSTVAIDEGRISRHIVPLIGSTRASDLRRQDVQRMADDIARGKTAGVFKGKPRAKAVVTGGAGTAARVVELLGGIFTWAEARGLVSGPNPVRGVDRVRGDTNERVLDHAKLVALGRSLDATQARADETARQQAARRGTPLDAATPLPRNAAAAAVRLIALTGMRREEACGLRWHAVDFDGHCLRLDKTKTGRSKRPIGQPALDLLRELSRTKTSVEWVFPNRSNADSADLKKAIAKLFDTAGLKDARSQVLRATFCSVADAEGYSIATVKELIGHSRRGVTERHYIRRPDSALVAAADRVSNRIAEALDGKKPAEILDLDKHRVLA
jgi:integrase